MLCQVVIVYLWIIQDLYYKAENQLTQLFFYFRNVTLNCNKKEMKLFVC